MTFMIIQHNTVVGCNMEILKSHLISFVHNLFRSGRTILTISTEYSRYIGILSTKFRNYWKTAMDVVDKRDFTRFVFMVNFGGISYIATTRSVQVS